MQSLHIALQPCCRTGETSVAVQDDVSKQIKEMPSAAHRARKLRLLIGFRNRRSFEDSSCTEPPLANPVELAGGVL